MAAGVAASMVLAAVVAAGPGAPFDVALHVDSGSVTNATDARAVVFSEVISIPEASWIRLVFDRADLAPSGPSGQPTVIRVTSLIDGARQTLTAGHLEQWRDRTAFFNGHALLLEIVADPATAPSRVSVSHAVAGPLAPMISSICGINDDRVPSSDPRMARKFPSGCTVFLIDDPNHCFVTAGHCNDVFQIVEFNVPLSNGNGAVQHPAPADQYNVDADSFQGSSEAVGDDWAYFGCFRNTETDLLPFEAQGDWFDLASTPPPLAGQNVRITGYGDTSPPTPREWNGIQKSASGPYAGFEGTILSYAVDTTVGNSGSPILDTSTGEVIGVHTHGGCDGEGGANLGTAINHPALLNALANPLGVCIPAPCPTDVNGDEQTAFADLVAVLSAWGPCPGCPEDIDGNDDVGFSDLLLLLANWGACPPMPG